jgi:hypothetical protein
MTAQHNHPPRCCCVAGWIDEPDDPCRLCPEHGELAQLGNPQPGECPLCHSEIGKQHTDYCRFDGVVSTLPVKVADHPTDWTATVVSLDPLEGTDMTHSQTSQPATRTSQPTTFARDWCSAVGGRHLDGCTPDHCASEPTPTAEDTPGSNCPSCLQPRNTTPGPGCGTPTRHP